MKENCRHASAERSKAFSLRGKYLKANIQLTLLLLQTPATCRCLVHPACRVVQLHADRCLDTSIFLSSQQDKFPRKRNYTEPRGSDRSLKLAVLIREHMKGRDSLPNSLEARGADLKSKSYCWEERADGCSSINQPLWFFWNSFFFLICCKSSKNHSVSHLFPFFFCLKTINGIESVKDSLNRPQRTGSMLDGNIHKSLAGIDPQLAAKNSNKKRLLSLSIIDWVVTMTACLQGHRCSQWVEHRYTTTRGTGVDLQAKPGIFQKDRQKVRISPSPETFPNLCD